MAKEKSINLVYGGRALTAKGTIVYRYLMADGSNDEILFKSKIEKCSAGSLISCVEKDRGTYGNFEWEGLAENEIRQKALMFAEAGEQQIKQRRDKQKKTPSVVDDLLKVLDEHGFFEMKWDQGELILDRLKSKAISKLLTK